MGPTLCTHKDELLWICEIILAHYSKLPRKDVEERTEAHDQNSDKSAVEERAEVIDKNNDESAVDERTETMMKV